MKKSILIMISILIAVLFIVGCSSDVVDSDNMESIEDNSSEDANDEVDNSTETSDDEEVDDSDEEEPSAEDNQALIQELMDDLEGIEIDENEEEDEEETETGNYTIELINMRGEPEKNIDIGIGSSVTFISRQPNYVHRIQLRLKFENGSKGDFLLDPSAALHEDEEFTYIFYDDGEYEWYSKTNYPVTSGTITVE